MGSGMRPPPLPNQPTTSATASTAVDTSSFNFIGVPEDDYSFYYSFLQDPFSAVPDLGAAMQGGGGPPAPAGGPGGGGGGGGGKRKKAPVDDAEDKRKVQKTTGIAQLLTSLAALEGLEKAERDQRDAADHDRVALLEANYSDRKDAMLGYYSDMKGYYDDIEESSAGAAKRGRVASTAAAAAAAAAEELDPVEADRLSGGSSGGSAPAAPLAMPAAQQQQQQSQQQPHQRRLWVKDRSRAWWDECIDPNYPPAEFKRHFRMSRATFDMICEELGGAVAKEDTMLRAAIPVQQRVAVCIWRLATGEPLRLVSKRFGLGISTCHKLVLEVCTAIRSVLMTKYLQWPADPEPAKQRFEAMSGIPSVVGSMYTTHIPIIAPKISVAAYFNKRHTERNQKTSYSITVQGVVDPDGVFTDVCIGWPGSYTDDKVLESSLLYRRASGGSLNNQWVVGGKGFPLLDWVLVPYTHQNLTWAQHGFNEKIGEVQRVAKDAFARLKGRWKCLQKRTEVKLTDLPVVLGACCVLHNVCEKQGETIEPDLAYDLVDDETLPERPIWSQNAIQARDSISHNLLHRGHAGTTFF